MVTGKYRDGPVKTRRGEFVVGRDGLRSLRSGLLQPQSESFSLLGQVIHWKLLYQSFSQLTNDD